MCSGMKRLSQPANCGNSGPRGAGAQRQHCVWFCFGLLLLPCCNPAPPPGDETKGVVSLSVGVEEALASPESIVAGAELGSEAASEVVAGCTLLQCGKVAISPAPIRPVPACFRNCLRSVIERKMRGVQSVNQSISQLIN